MNEVKKHDKLIRYIETTGILIAKQENVIKNDDEENCAIAVALLNASQVN